MECLAFDLECCWREPPIYFLVQVPVQCVGYFLLSSASCNLCGVISGHAYGEEVGGAVGTQLHLTDALYEAGVRSTDPAALNLAENACLLASAPVNSSLYFSHEIDYVLSRGLLCGPV